MMYSFRLSHMRRNKQITGELVETLVIGSNETMQTFFWGLSNFPEMELCTFPELRLWRFFKEPCSVRTKIKYSQKKKKPVFKFDSFRNLFHQNINVYLIIYGNHFKNINFPLMLSTFQLSYRHYKQLGRINMNHRLLLSHLLLLIFMGQIIC